MALAVNGPSHVVEPGEEVSDAPGWLVLDLALAVPGLLTDPRRAGEGTPARRPGEGVDLVGPPQHLCQRRPTVCQRRPGLTEVEDTEGVALVARIGLFVVLRQTYGGE